MRNLRHIQAVALVCMGVTLLACRPQNNTTTQPAFTSTGGDQTTAEVPRPAPTSEVEETTADPVTPTSPTSLPTPQTNTPKTEGEEETEPAEPVVRIEGSTTSDAALFEDLLDNHWSRIFPNGRRNVGGPQFFKYIYERLATDHNLFKRYSKFYCGVSGAIVRPRDGDVGRYDTVKIKDENGECVIGKYFRCCWPCVCDIMKHARAEAVTVQLPLDETQTEETYWVLTMGDPCHRCEASPCPDLPPEVQAYQCQNGITANGLRVHNGQFTTGAEGRLVFALLHDAGRREGLDARPTYSPPAASGALL